ncbi:hypothetical protein [Burkholderia sp. BCC1985]|uniref:hypothetical protein n=1 Tax=Burkholderia sp. BCC1985 TaxID=2817442 RepID=UPI002AB17E82|nr:hypothetical protein [Burkholderia sp. BCC1985]
MNDFLESGAYGEHDALVEQYKKIKAENAALRAEIDSQKNNIETRFVELAALTKLLEARNHQIFLANSACLSLEGKINVLMESFSWRSTAPLRRFVALFRRKNEVPSGTHFLRKLIMDSGCFDRNWYVGHHPEVLDSGIDPIQYFISYGIAKWHDPGPNFSCDKYIGKYPDVAVSGIPPFLHFIRHGMAEGRNSL